MEGSIADSTALRIRSQLQRVNHSAPNANAGDFLDELLKIPVASASVEPEESPETTVESIAQPSAALTEEDSRPLEEADKEEEGDTDQSAAAPCVVVCYGPAPIAEPTQPVAPLEPEAEASEALTEVVSTDDVQAVPTQSTEEVVADSAVIIQSSPVVEVAEAVEPVTAAQPTAVTDTSVIEQTIEPSANTKWTSREGRSSKEPRAKATPLQHQPQPAADPIPQAPTAHTIPADQRVDTSADQPGSQARLQNSVEPVQGAGEPATATRESRRSDTSTERPKWYEGQSSGAVDGESLAEPDGPPANPADAEHALDTETLDAIGGLDTTGAADLASATPESVTQVDSSQLTSDLAASGATMAMPSSAASSVVSASAASGGDSSPRNQTGLSGPGAVAGGSGNSRTAGAASNSAQTSSRADETSQITQQERVRLVQRVARSFSRLGPEGGQVSLKLHPPQLGVLNVSIKIEGQTLTARLQTETTAARDVIVDNLPVLKERLSEQGIDVEKFQVEVGQQEDMASGGGGPGSFAGRDDADRGPSRSAPEIDFRRGHRGSPSRVDSPLLLEPKPQAWAGIDRTLDVRA